MAQEFTDTQSMQVLQIASDVLYIVITCGDFERLNSCVSYIDFAHSSGPPRW